MPQTPAPRNRQNKFKVTKESHNKKEDYITIPRKPRQEKVNVVTGNANKLFTNIPTGNITEVDKLIYPGANLVFNKIE